MFPWDKKRERFPYPPRGFEAEIKKLEEEFVNALGEGRPFSYGFTVVSVNGQPINQTIFRGQPEAVDQNQKEREPLVDIIEEKEHTKVLVDLPGVEKNDIQLTAEGNTLEVKVDTEGRRYHKKIELPHSVKNPEAEYKNGVLEVKLKKETSRKNLKIE